MLIQIESGKKDDPRKVTVTPDEGEPFEFDAANIAEAHKTLKAGQKHGWDSIRPDVQKDAEKSEAFQPEPVVEDAAPAEPAQPLVAEESPPKAQE